MLEVYPLYGASPQGITIDKNGNVWVTDSNLGNVTEISSSGSITNYSTDYGTFGGLTVITRPEYITADKNNDLWVTSSESYYLLPPTDEMIYLGGLVEEMSNTGKILHIYNSTNSPVGEPGEVTVDPYGNIWITGQDVVELSSAGTVIGNYARQDYTTLAAAGNSGNVFVYSPQPGIGKVMKLSSTGSILVNYSIAGAGGIAVDSSGNLWVTNSTQVGTLTEFSGSGDTKLGTYLVGNYPTSVAIDPTSGNIWVASTESGKNVLIKLSGTNKAVSAYPTPDCSGLGSESEGLATCTTTITSTITTTSTSTTSTSTTTIISPLLVASQWASPNPIYQCFGTQTLSLYASWTGGTPPYKAGWGWGFSYPSTPGVVSYTVDIPSTAYTGSGTSYTTTLNPFTAIDPSTGNTFISQPGATGYLCFSVSDSAGKSTYPACLFVGMIKGSCTTSTTIPTTTIIPPTITIGPTPYITAEVQTDIALQTSPTTTNFDRYGNYAAIYSQEVGAKCVTLNGAPLAGGFFTDTLAPDQPSGTYTVTAAPTCQIDGNTPFRFIGFGVGGGPPNSNSGSTTYTVTIPPSQTVTAFYQRERPTVTLYDLYGAGSNLACGYGNYMTKIQYGTDSYQYYLAVSKFAIDGSNPADGSITATTTQSGMSWPTTTYTYDSNYYYRCSGPWWGNNLYPQFSSWQVQSAGGGTFQPGPPAWQFIITNDVSGIKGDITATATWGPVYVPYEVDLSQMQCVNGQLAGTTITRRGFAAAGTTITSSTWPQSCGPQSGPGWFGAGYYKPNGDGYGACVNPLTMTLVANFTTVADSGSSAYRYWSGQPQYTCSQYNNNIKTDLPPTS